MPKRDTSRETAAGKKKGQKRPVVALAVAGLLMLALLVILALRLLPKPSEGKAPAAAETPAAAAAATAEPAPDAQEVSPSDETPAPDAAGETGGMPDETLLLDYQGYWEDVSEPLNTAKLLVDQNGQFSLTVGFYRLVGMDAANWGERDGDGWLVFRDPYSDAVVHLLPGDGIFTLYVEVPEDYSYSPSFGREHEYVFRRREASDTAWLGTWRSEDGETLEIEEQGEDFILLTYTGLTASGESSFTSRYILYFEDPDGLIAAEDKAVEQSAGWCYRLQLDGDTIIMHSRYPDKLFHRWVLQPAA